MATGSHGDTPRVLHVIGGLGIGGAESYLMNCYRAIDREKFQFDFVVYGSRSGVYDKEIEALGGRIYRLDPPSDRGLRKTVDDLCKVINAGGPYRAVHAHVLYASAWALRAAHRSGVPIRIAHSHSAGYSSSTVRRRLYEGLARFLIKRHSTDRVACGTEAAANLYSDGDWKLLRNGIDLNIFRPWSGSEVASLRSELGLSGGPVVLGAVSRLEDVKNHRFMLEIADFLESAEFDFALLVVGDGSLRNELEEIVREKGLRRRISFLGNRPDIAALMNSMDVLLLPSKFEGLPVSLLESQAVQLPALVSDRVSDEADLGLGLVHFLPLGHPEPWAQHIMSLGRRELDASTPGALAKLRSAGVAIEDGARELELLYSLDTSLGAPTE